MYVVNKKTQGNAGISFYLVPGQWLLLPVLTQVKGLELLLGLWPCLQILWLWKCVRASVPLPVNKGQSCSKFLGSATLGGSVGQRRVSEVQWKLQTINRKALELPVSCPLELCVRGCQATSEQLQDPASDLENDPSKYSVAHPPLFSLPGLTLDCRRKARSWALCKEKCPGSEYIYSCCMVSFYCKWCWIVSNEFLKKFVGIIIWFHRYWNTKLTFSS